jgi:hypothetical protein
MEKRGFVCILSMILLVAVAGCAGMETAHHKYMMRGAVLDVTGDMAYLCIGTADGAKAGQQLSVHRFEQMTIVGQGRPSGGFHKLDVGEVKITEVVDVHYARAKVLKGNVKVNDIVELRK